LLQSNHSKTVKSVTINETQDLFERIEKTGLESLTRDQMLVLLKAKTEFSELLLKENSRLNFLVKSQKELEIETQGSFLLLQNLIFGKSSEKVAPLETVTGADLNASQDQSQSSSSSQKENSNSGERILKSRRVRLPSERYPEAPLEEKHVEFKEVPSCSCCNEPMQVSSMTESSEYIEKIPASIKVIREIKHKYRCDSCHGDIKTTPAIPRIKRGSAFGDSMIIDVAVSKYCDLIPIDRQVRIYERLGFPGLPPQSLIETTHYLAQFLKPLLELIKNEVLTAKILFADETPHRMLEGSETQNWFFWGFSSKTAAYFEAKDTRSGDVAIEFLKKSDCAYLMSDVYSGYVRTTKSINEDRERENRPLLQKIYCNAHARRKFIEAKVFKKESDFFILKYQKIYLIEASNKGLPEDEILKNRQKVRLIFKEMWDEAIRIRPQYPEKSAINKAIDYFLKNFKEFTLFTDSAVAPIDNNHQERLLRNPVIGRKTWCGTHSERGAETAAILFSIIESCKINQINPRTYLERIVNLLHKGEALLTPSQVAVLFH
jgi:transposase